MRNFFRAILVCVAFATALPAQAAIKVLATTADWAALTRELGGDQVNVYAATTAMQDAHRVEAKPSLVARARSADLVVATGAQLEIGWLPVLLQESGNPRVRPGQPGYFEATAQVRLLEVPSSVDRALGDIHPLGNPHVHLDPANIATIATALTERLSQIDAPHASYYAERGKDFQARWKSAMERWNAEGAALKGVTVVVIHRDQAYLCHWLGLQEVAAIEPKPGVPPSAGYLSSLVAKLTSAPPRLILRNAYNDSKAVTWLSARVHAPVVTLPYSVGGSDEAKDLFGLFDDTLKRLKEALR